MAQFFNIVPETTQNTKKKAITHVTCDLYCCVTRKIKQLTLTNAPLLWNMFDEN